MKKYYVSLVGRACTCAAEKAIYPWLRDEFDQTVVSERAIRDCIEARINKWLEEYNASHKGRAIECSVFSGGVGYYVNAGQLCLSLTEIKREII